MRQTFVGYSRGHVVVSVFPGGLFKLRRSEPQLERSYRAPCYPWFPAFALLGAIVCLLAMFYSSGLVGATFVGLMALGYPVFRLASRRRRAARDPASRPETA